MTVFDDTFKYPGGFDINNLRIYVTVGGLKKGSISPSIGFKSNKYILPSSSSTNDHREPLTSSIGNEFKAEKQNIKL